MKVTVETIMDKYEQNAIVEVLMDEFGHEYDDFTRNIGGEKFDNELIESALKQLSDTDLERLFRFLEDDVPSKRPTLNSDPKIPSRISLFIHCGMCLKELPDGMSPREYSHNEIGYTKQGLQVFCIRHEANVADIDLHLEEL